MKGDFSRLTFDPKKHYSGVRMQQGRVQLDADWNEQVDITEHRIENLFTDLIGDSGAPQGDHFKISVDNNDFKIGKGRIYVAGLLCENDVECSYTEQPYFHGAKLPNKDGHYLCYLDVWQRLITVLEDPNFREPALGGPDSAARVQNVWQVKLEEVNDKEDILDGTLKGLKDKAISTGKMAATWDPQSTPPENQLYRVEIHTGGEADQATFKWSRDNGAIAARVDSITSSNTEGLTVILSQEGPATQSWFSPNEYIEFSNEALTLSREPGILAKLVRVEGLTLTTENSKVALTEQQTELLKKWPPEEPGENPIVRRWDSAGEVKVEAADNDGWIELEHGIRVKFEKGNYKTGDYWLIPARRNDPRGIMFPKEAQPSKGVRHYYAPLALLERSKKKWQLIKDLLAVFSPLTTGLVSKAGDTMTGPLEIDNEKGNLKLSNGLVLGQNYLYNQSYEKGKRIVKGQLENMPDGTFIIAGPSKNNPKSFLIYWAAAGRYYQFDASMLSMPLEPLVETIFNPREWPIKLPNIPKLNPSKEITLETWFNTDALGKRQSIITKSHTSNQEPYYQYNLELRPEGKLYFALAINGNRQVIDNAFSVRPQEWYHVAATYDRTWMRLYLDGKPWEPPTRIKGTLGKYPKPVVIGGATSNYLKYPFTGQLAGVRIWNVARTRDKIIAAAMSKLQATDEEGLVWSSDTPYPLIVHLPDNAFSASSIWGQTQKQKDDHAPHNARFDQVATHSNWSAATNDTHQWLQVDLGRAVMIHAVATKGRAQTCPDWVTSYKLQYSNDGETWEYYRQNDDPHVFKGNTDINTEIRHDLPRPFKTRYLRFLPVAWNRHITMRVEAYGWFYVPSHGEND